MSNLTIEKAIELANQVAKSDSIHAQDNADLALFLSDVVKMRKRVADLKKLGKKLIQRDIDNFGMAHVMKNIPKDAFLEFTGGDRQGVSDS